MKLLVVGDLHGHIPKIHFKEFDAIICVGDYCSSEKIWKHTKIQYQKFLKNPYNRKAWYDDIGRTKAKKLIKESLNAGRKVLIKLNSLNVPIYSIPGNWDFVNEDDEWTYLNKDYYKTFLIKGLKNVKDCNQKISKIDNMNKYNIIGYGVVNGPELLKYRSYKNIKKTSYVKNEKRYKRLLSKYNKLFMKSKKADSSRSTILLSHNVPYNTPLDKIINKDSPMNGHHYGSNLARDMIVKHKPILCIGGHMHEHYGTCKIGKTIVLNAGFGGEKNTLIELENGKIKSIKFYGKKK